MLHQNMIRTLLLELAFQLALAAYTLGNDEHLAELP